MMRNFEEDFIECKKLLISLNALMSVVFKIQVSRVLNILGETIEIIITKFCLSASDSGGKHHWIAWDILSYPMKKVVLILGKFHMFVWS